MKIYGFWISPEGEIFTIEDEFGHRTFIENLFKTSFKTDDDCVKETLDDGWIRIVNKREFIVSYKYLICSKQLSAIKECVKKVEENGYFHDTFYLERNSGSRADFYAYDSIKDLINKIKYWSC